MTSRSWRWTTGSGPTIAGTAEASFANTASTLSGPILFGSAMVVIWVSSSSALGTDAARVAIFILNLHLIIVFGPRNRVCQSRGDLLSPCWDKKILTPAARDALPNV